MKTSHFLFALVALLLAWTAAGCGAATPAATPEGDLPSAEPGQTPTGDPQAEPSNYEPVDIPDAGLSLQVPAGWRRLEPEWAWTAGEADGPRVGVRWADLEPPAEAEAALLPRPSQTLRSDPVALSWGSGRRFVVEVYGPAAEGGDGRAPVQSVEAHVLIVVPHPQAGARRAYDFYAAGRDSDALAALLPVLDAMLASAAPTAAQGFSAGGAQGEEEAPAAAHPDWPRFTSEAFLVSFRVPPGWQRLAGYDERYGGPEGFVQFGGIASGGQSLQAVCANEASHKLQPYGSRPQIEPGQIQGQEACWIWPSEDQPVAMEGTAALLVRLPEPVQVNRESYDTLIMWADQGHLGDIGAGLDLARYGQ